MPELKTCPHCAADLHNGRAIGVEIRGVYDGVLFWGCPDCGGSWHRWSPDDWPRLHEAAVWYVGPPKKTAAELEGLGIDV